MSKYKLDDKTIGQIAKCVQIAILTGTDIVDHLRQLDLEVSEETLKITINQEYLSMFDQNIEKMLSEASAAEEEKKSSPRGGTEQLSLFE
tara:strand:+ start:510 stop:779 length:270 start_codon:yes stop_codon:yes gene_type:complete